MQDLINYFYFFTKYDISFKQIVSAILIITLTFIFRKIFVSIFMHYIRKLTQKTKTDIDDKLVNALDPPARSLIMSIGFIIAFNVLGFEINDSTFLGHIMRSVIIAILFWILYRTANILTDILSDFSKKTETVLDDLLLPFFNKSIKVVVVILGITTIIDEWGYNIGSLVAGLGLGGLAFALAAQDTVSNLFGGVTIMLDKPFSIGDWISTSSVEGTVEEIGFRSTRILTFSQAIVTVPNSTLINTPVTNWSRMGKRRINFNIGVTYKTSAKQMSECVNKLKEMLENHDGVHKETIMVYFESFGDSSLQIFMYFFTKTIAWDEYLKVKQDINLKIMNIIEELDLEMAFPSTSIYIETPETLEAISNNQN